MSPAFLLGVSIGPTDSADFKPPKEVEMTTQYDITAKKQPEAKYGYFLKSSFLSI